jgi:hypothetical protein
VEDLKRFGTTITLGLSPGVSYKKFHMKNKSVFYVALRRASLA